MNLVIDIGNTNAKLCVYDGCRLQERLVVESGGDALEASAEALVASHGIRGCIVGSVSAGYDGIERMMRRLGVYFLALTSATDVPIRNCYSTPHTLGMDRLAAAVGAQEFFPSGSDVLIIDAGTAITYDCLLHGTDFVGGNIAPGIRLRFKSLNDYTSRLPLVDVGPMEGDFGTSTQDAIRKGVVLGVVREIEGYIADFKQKNVKPEIILTGGDSIFLSKLLKIAIFAEPNLVTIGLNRILNYNVSKNS